MHSCKKNHQTDEHGLGLNKAKKKAFNLFSIHCKHEVESLSDSLMLSLSVLVGPLLYSCNYCNSVIHSQTTNNRSLTAGNVCITFQAFLL